MNRHDYDKAVKRAVGELRGAVPQFGMSTAEVVAHFHWDNQDEDNEWARTMLHKARFGLNRPPILRVLRHAATLARLKLLPSPLILSRPFDR